MDGVNCTWDLGEMRTGKLQNRSGKISRLKHRQTKRMGIWKRAIDILNTVKKIEYTCNGSSKRNTNGQNQWKN